MTWKTSDMEKGGQALWLTRLCTKTLEGVRTNGLPSDGYYLSIEVPTLTDQANSLHERAALETSCIRPSGEVEFISTVDDV